MNSHVSIVRRGWPVLLAAALVGFSFVPGIDTQGMDVAELGSRPLDALGVTLIVAMGAPAAFVARWPAVSLAVSGLAFCAHQLLGYPTVFASIGVLVAVVAAAGLVNRCRLVVAAAGFATYVLLAMTALAVGSPSSPLDFMTFGVLLGLLWALGSWMRVRRHTAAEHRMREERQIIATERARIARELHDVVTHHVTAMVIQADAAAHVTSEHETSSRASLERIGEAGRAALTDLRLMLGALDGSADESRIPVVLDMGEAIAHARAAGQPVELREVGVPRELTGAVRLALTRVAQEGLTNALKHALGAPTHVTITYREAEVELQITTEPGSRPSVAKGSGRGLVGLRERVELLGGELRTGASEKGFRLCALIPA